MLTHFGPYGRNYIYLFNVNKIDWNTLVPFKSLKFLESAIQPPVDQFLFHFMRVLFLFGKIMCRYPHRGFTRLCSEFWICLCFITDPKGRQCFHRCLSVHNRPHGYWFTARPCYSAVGTHPTWILSCFLCFLTSTIVTFFNLSWWNRENLIQILIGHVVKRTKTLS